MFNTEAEREKILSGEYPSRIQKGKQRKHIPGTREFTQNRDKMKKLSPDSEPAIIEVDAAELVRRFKGTGIIKMKPKEQYPRERVLSDSVIGKTWVKSIKKYVSTRMFEIVYSSDGTHIIPVNEFMRG